MIEQSVSYGALKEIAGLLLGKSPAPDSARSAKEGAGISAIDREIIKSVWVFAAEHTAGDVESGETADSITWLGHLAGLALAEKLRDKVGNAQDFFKGYTRVKSSFTNGLCRKTGETAQLRQDLMRLDFFCSGLAAGFSQGQMRSVKTKFRRRLQEAKLYVLQEKKRYATVFYQMNDPAFVVDFRLRLIDLNPACEKFFGVNKGELKGMTCCELIGNDFCSSCPLEEIIATGGSFSNLEIAVPPPTARGTVTGDKRTILLAGTALGGLHDGNMGGIVIFQDITERKKTEEELDVYRTWLEDLVDERTEELLAANEKLQREITERRLVEKELIQVTASLKRSNVELEQFAQVASHDLQEPLMLVASFAERLTARYASSFDERGRDYLARITKGTRKLQNLVDALLRLTRVATSTAIFEPLDLNELIRDVVADLDEIISRSGARVDINLQHDLNGDAVQIRQLFQNLISNAIKYRRENEIPSVSITSRVIDDVCEITVEDNGIGLGEADTERIFEPFVRLHGRDLYEGSGMGLTTCKKIVTRHGGEIMARAKPECGAVFIVRLPLRQQPGKKE